MLLISTYEIGRQPFGLASPAAWLRTAGFEVDCLDLAIQQIDEGLVAAADLVAFYVPMHTATRIAVAQLPVVRAINPAAHLCFFGLYAPVNEGYLRSLGVGTVLGGEVEEGLLSLVRRLATGDGPEQAEPVISLSRQQFLVPDRHGLPTPDRYAHVVTADGTLLMAGSTEASRGCLHLCRHCPVVPVYGGRLRVVQRDVVMEDVRRQVAAGAAHITFGDPDFFNAPRHSETIVRALHAEHPGVSYDVTIKVEHLLAHRRLLPLLRDTGCLYVTTAVEAVDDATLQIYEKNHSRADFVEVVTEFRRVGLTLNPTFVTFSPWTTLDSYADLLRLLVELDLVDNVASIQLAIRLLVPAGSRLLELAGVRALLDPFDQAALCYPWHHPDRRVDDLYQAVRSAVEDGAAAGRNRREVFRSIWTLTHATLDADPVPVPASLFGDPSPAPHATEPWYCCAEPTEQQLAGPGLNRSGI
nr:CUAEP/CCAEP-tail radical SAM protein [Virgisporangium aurantiacum]